MTNEPKWTPAFDPTLAERITETARAIQRQTVAGLGQHAIMHGPRELARLIRIGAYREQDIQWESPAMRRQIMGMVRGRGTQ